MQALEMAIGSKKAIANWGGAKSQFNLSLGASLGAIISRGKTTVETAVNLNRAIGLISGC
jgi:hypothetical protein